MMTEQNPFKRDDNGNIPSISAVSSLIKTDPARAERLCKEAGENWAAWMPKNPR